MKIAPVFAVFMIPFMLLTPLRNLAFESAAGPGRNSSTPLPNETTVTIHTEDARALLEALSNPQLSREAAMDIARMHGNQGAIRKLQEFKIASTTESFANALYASAHNQPVTSLAESAIGLESVKPKIRELLALLDKIETSPNAFQGAIEQRIRMFAPAEMRIPLNGYVVAAGDGAGYTFGDTDFFLNIGFADDFAIAKSTTTHELYHSVQGAYAEQRRLALSPFQGRAQQACSTTEQLFSNLYEEGSARYVEDISLLAQSKSEAGRRILADVNDGIAHVQTGVTLLDMSVMALEAAMPLTYDDVYRVGFLSHGVLYGIGYVMARDIVESDGNRGLSALLKQPSYRFVLRYTELAKYGTDAHYPELGFNTVAAARRLAAGCK